MTRKTMKFSLVLTVMAALLFGYTNCSQPNVTDNGASPYSSLSSESTYAISPADKSINWSSSLQLDASGGTEPYRYTLVAGGGSVDYYSGLYTAPAMNSTAIIEVQDATGARTQTNVYVSLNSSSTLGLSYLPTSISVGNTATLSASGGKAPYTYFMVSGVGAISGSTFRATSFGAAVVGVRDSLGATATFTINVGSTTTITTKLIYRAYNSSAKQYIYSLGTSEGTGSGGFVYEGAVFKVLSGTYLSTVALTRCYIPSNGARYLSTSGTCGSYTNEGTLGYVYTYNATNSAPLFNCFKSSTGTYLSSTDYSVCVNNGFNVQSTLGYVPL